MDQTMIAHKEIHEVLKIYFDSIFFGDADLLRTAFHRGAILAGEIKGQPYYKTLEEYLNVLKNRKSPHELGEIYRMETLSVEVLDQIALVKTHCQMLGFNYFDFLSLVRENGKWLIVSKLFTHVE